VNHLDQEQEGDRVKNTCRTCRNVFWTDATLPFNVPTSCPFCGRAFYGLTLVLDVLKDGRHD
jgi:hypothetical protein